MVKPFGRIMSYNASPLRPALNADVFSGPLGLLYLTEVIRDHLEFESNEIMWRTLNRVHVRSTVTL